MIQLIKKLMLCVIFFPLTSYSSLYTIEYTGQINDLYGTGLGFQLGQNISGTLLLNTDLAVDTQPGNANQAFYKSSVGNDFVTGYWPSGLGRNADFVLVENGYDAINSPSGYDAFGIGDFIINDQAHDTYFFELYAILPHEWLPDKNIKEFDFTSANSFSGRLYGYVSYRHTFYNQDGTGWSTNDQALFSLDKFKLQAVNVAEPSSAILLTLGITALLIRRKLKSF